MSFCDEYPVTNILCDPNTPLPLNVTEAGAELQDGWIAVEILNSPELSGLVPHDYLGKLNESGSTAAPVASSNTARSAGETSQQFQASTVNPSLQLQTSSANSSLLGSSLIQPQGALEEFSQLFASHEAWFKAAMAKRQEVYATLRAEAADVLKALREGEAKSEAVLARIGELGKLVAQERSRYVRS